MPSPEVDAIALAQHVLGVAQLILASPPAVPDGFEFAFDQVVRRRAAREPLQHIVGSAAFRRLSVRVEPGVFVPRPETEIVAEAAIDEARRLLALGAAALIVDLCTGSGVIALSVALEAPGSQVVAIDVDPTAVALARSNADALGLSDPTDELIIGKPPVSSTENPGSADDQLRRRGSSGRGGGAIRIEVGDVTDRWLLADLDTSVDVVISNPPYIPDGAVPLDPEVAEHDPRSALFGGGPDGLDLPRHVVDAAARLLRPGGLLVMEHADVQGAAVRTLVDRTAAFDPATTHRDLTGRDRFVLTRRR